jgi:hypothetical protein
MDTNERNDGALELAVDNSALAALTSAEIDQQVTTARKFPRTIKRFLQEVEQMACLSDDIANECTYVLPRKDRSGQTKNIEGPSVRFAEIVASAWGNSRIGARIIGEDSDFIIAQGVFHDLERNVAISFENRRRITDKNGRRFSADMVAVTGNAAASIALRNAIFKGVPKAYWGPAWQKSRQVAMGDAKTLGTRRIAAMEAMRKLGATDQQVLDLFAIKGIEDLGLEHLAQLRGIMVAVRDGETSIEQAFAGPAPVGPVAQITQPDAPAQMIVEESDRLGDAPSGDLPPAEPKKRRAKKVEVEPAPVPQPKAKEPEPEPEPQHDVEREVAEQSDDDEPPAEKIDLPLRPDATVLLPHQISEAHVEDGCIAIEATGRILQCVDGNWQTPVAESIFEDFVKQRIRRALTDGFGRAKLQRLQAMALVAEHLKISPPASMADLTIKQLLLLASRQEVERV